MVVFCTCTAIVAHRSLTIRDKNENSPLFFGQTAHGKRQPLTSFRINTYAKVGEGVGHAASYTTCVQNVASRDASSASFRAFHRKK